MEIEVNDAARRLGVNESRVRQLLRAGSLRGRRVGNSWLVQVDDVARLEKNRLRAGRPLAARRAWAALDLLGSGHAPWVSAPVRSQVRNHLEHLNAPGPEVWLSLLRSRSHVVHALAHPAALKRLAAVAGVVHAGASEAVHRDFDLVALGDSVPEFYIDASAWPQLSRSLAIRESISEPNVLIRIPNDVWPFGDWPAVSDAVLAADLLESGEPRAVSAGASRLNDLLAQWQQARAQLAARRDARRPAQRQAGKDTSQESRH